MFPRKSIDLVILAILEKYPDGLTGYSIVKTLKEWFPYNDVPSPGTIYPHLKKMAQNGDLIALDDDKTFKLSEQGKNRLTEILPAYLQKSFQFLPSFLRRLLKTLPMADRVDYFAKFPSSWGNLCSMSFDDPNLDHFEAPSLKLTLEQLNLMKTKLQSYQDRLTKDYQKELAQIDTRLKQIDARIEKCNLEKDKWTKIPIKEGDFDET